MTKLFNQDPLVKEIPGILYYVRFYNEDIEFWKIGITSKTVDKRFTGLKRLNREVLFEDKDTFYNCFKKEQEILRKYKDHRINIKEDYFSSTECFSIDVLEKKYKQEVTNKI